MSREGLLWVLLCGLAAGVNWGLSAAAFKTLSRSLVLAASFVPALRAS